MKPATISQEEFTANGVKRLYVALELSAREWRLACAGQMGDHAWHVVVPAGDRARLLTAVARAKARFGLGADTPVWSCYEAGRDGWWPHRLLTQLGMQSVVVDSSSIEVNRRTRHAKTDRLDAGKLLRMLIRWALGEQQVWHVAHVPTPATEAARQAPRTITTLTTERTRWRNRIHGLLATEGIRLRITPGFERALETVVTWEGAPVPAALRMRVLSAWRLLRAIETELAACRTAQRTATRTAAPGVAATARRLVQLRGIGDRFAWVVATEVCTRDLQNRRQVGALTGFTAVPYQSGTRAADQGISRSGIVALRHLAVENAWVWVRWQPDSELTRWFTRRFATGGPHARQIGIVALARKLVIALWRYSRDGVVPAGATLNRAIA